MLTGDAQSGDADVGIAIGECGIDPGLGLAGETRQEVEGPGAETGIGIGPKFQHFGFGTDTEGFEGGPTGVTCVEVG